MKKSWKIAGVLLLISGLVFNGWLYSDVSLTGILDSALSTLLAPLGLAMMSPENLDGNQIVPSKPYHLAPGERQAVGAQKGNYLLIIQFAALDDMPTWFYVRRGSPEGLKEKCSLINGQFDCPVAIAKSVTDWKGHARFWILAEEVRGLYVKVRPQPNVHEALWIEFTGVRQASAFEKVVRWRLGKPTVVWMWLHPLNETTVN